MYMLINLQYRMVDVEGVIAYIDESGNLLPVPRNIRVGGNELIPILTRTARITKDALLHV